MMKVFVSCAFNEANKWVSELVVPLVKVMGFQPVMGQQMEGEVLVEGVNARLRDCAGCIAFTTRRNQREDGTYETHPWVISEIHTARTLGFKTVEVREEGVTIGDDNEAYVRLNYTEGARDRLIIELAAVLALWIIRPVRIQLLPPEDGARSFIKQVVRGGQRCGYRLESGGRMIGSGEALIQPYKAGFFVDIEVPRDGDVLVQLEVKNNDGGAWMSLGDGLSAIPVQLYDA